ncbi:interleukin-23 receptor [Heteronotia binoei]|uniref:interleukin-23 receptor n=1 Tax=Heteronotia binoei TaxID=13085 RepID=UPI00292F3795|nr:interleukin-23 receptor [Heteronotia binoei]
MGEERGKRDKQPKFKHTVKNTIKIVIVFPDVVLCAGQVWTEPSQVIPMGQNVSIYCHSPTELCTKAKLYIELNGVRVEDRFLSFINKTTVQLQLQDFNAPFSIAVCYASCPLQTPDEVVCGTEFCMGYLPDKPANLTCFIYEHLADMRCTWDPGKYTHLNTRYSLNLKSLQTEENNTFPSSSHFCVIPLTSLQKNQRFSIQVYAENDLGAVHSDPLHIDLMEIAIPVTPAITQIETVEYPVFKTIIQWEKQTALSNTHCEERHKETTSETWHVRELVAERDHYTEYNLDANTKYEFQVRCKLIQAGKFWSTWSEPVTYTTPEAEPSSVLDVWRYLGPHYPNGSQEVTILIKPFHPKESRGRILGYRVFCENQGKNIILCNTPETKCKMSVPATVSYVYVIAQNSKGSSKPANITVNQQSFNYHDFPPPTHMQIREELKGISVMWELPLYFGKPVLWYIVEWTYAGWHSHHQYDILWGKVPSQNTTMYIPEDIQTKNYFNILVYAVYHDGISEACSVQSHSNGLSIGFPDGPTGNTLESTSPVSYHDDVGVLLGIGIGVAFLSFFLLALISKKSFRKRISTVFISVTPKWLLEDYPQVQKSNVIRMFQERNSSAMHIFNWLVLDYEDAVVTEVEETLIDKECKPLDNNRETKESASNISLPEALLVNSSDIAEENGYKPQVCNKVSLCSNSCETYSQNLDTKSNLPGSPMNILIKDYMSPIASIWPTEDMDGNTLLLEKVNLILSNNTSGQSKIFTSTEESNRAMENQWKLPLSENNIQEQTLIPDELLSCLRTVNENTDLMSYFPQTIVK